MLTHANLDFGTSQTLGQTRKQIPLKCPIVVQGTIIGVYFPDPLKGLEFHGLGRDLSPQVPPLRMERKAP